MMKKIVFALMTLFFFSMTLLTSCLPEKTFGVKRTGTSSQTAAGYGTPGEKNTVRDMPSGDSPTVSDDLRQIVKKASDTSDKKALLIGVGDYPSLQGKSLRGPQNDVALIKNEFLIPILGYRPDEIKILASPNPEDPAGLPPTKENIVRMMEDWFLKGDHVKERFFFFAGHGSQTEDLDGDENDGKDEVILAREAAWENHKLRRETLIIDDDIREWFEKLEGKKLIAVFDSCNSGTVCRSIDTDISVKTSRFVQNSFDENRRGVTRGETDRDESNFTDRIPKNHVYFYAAESSQTADEKFFGDTGLHQGCFTKAFIKSVKELLRNTAQKRSISDVSYLDLYVAVNDEMKNKQNLSQTPDIQPAYRGEGVEYEGTDSEELLKPFLKATKDAEMSPVAETRLPDADRHKINVLLIQEGGNVLSLPDLGGSQKYASLDFEKREKGYDLYINIAEKSVKLSNGNGDLLNSFDYSGKTQLIQEIEKRIKHAFLKDLLAKIKSPQAFPMSLRVEYEGKDYDKNDFYCGQKITYLLESKAGADVYVYVFSVNAAGSELNLYLPFECQKNNRIRQGERIRILDEQCSKDYELRISDEPGEEILKVIASPKPLNIKMAQEGIGGASAMTFEQALGNVKDVIAQLKACDIWYEDTRKYMNHELSDYNKIVGN